MPISQKLYGFEDMQDMPLSETEKMLRELRCIEQSTHAISNQINNIRHDMKIIGITRTRNITYSS